MNMGLYKIPLHEDETTATYCARLAAANGLRPGPFCLDMGFTFDGIARGNADALQLLSDVSGISLERLSDNACVSRGYGRAIIRGEEVFSHVFRVIPSRLCPKCIQGDGIANRGLHPEYHRIHWLATGIRTCHIHNVPILDLTKKNLSSDFTFRLQVNALVVHRARLSTEERAFTQFEQFILDRLERKKGHSPFLDALPLNTIADLSQLVGVYTVFGKNALIDQLSDAEMHRASEVGFLRLKPGMEGFTGFLGDMASDVNWKRLQGGGIHIFGWIYNKLKEAGRQASHKVFRDALVNFAWEKLPLKHDTILYGKMPATGLISVAHKERVMNGSRANVRSALNYIAGNTGSEATLFSAEQIEETTRFLEDKITGLQVHAALGVTSALFQQMLKRGIISKSAEFGEAVPSALSKYSRLEVERVLQSVRVAQPAQAKGDLVPMLKATRRVGKPTIDLIVLLQQGKLSKVFYDPSDTGFNGVFVSPDEIRGLSKNLDVLSTNEVAAHIGERPAFVKILVGAKILSPLENKSFGGLGRGWGYARADIDAFCREYATMAGLAREYGVAWQTIRFALGKAGIVPIELGWNRVLYRREEAVAAMANRAA